MRSASQGRSGFGWVATTAALAATVLGCGESAGRRWLDPVLLESYGETAASPALALDARGDAQVLWQQHGTEAGLWSNDLGSDGWTGPVPVQLGEGVGFAPQIARNANGITFGLWKNIDLAVGWMRLRGARRLPGANWEPAVAIDGNAGRGDASNEQLAVLVEGGAVVVWENFNRILSNRFEPGTGWGSVEVLSRDVFAWDPLFRMDDSGNGLVLWLASGTWVARHLDPGGEWGPEERMRGTGFHFPKVVSGPRSEAVVLWQRVEPGTSGTFVHTGIWANRFVPGSGWTPLVPLAEEARLQCRTALAADATGNALAVWGCRTDPLEDKWGTWYSMLPAAGEWDAPRRLTSLAEGAEFHMLAGDRAGNAIGLWTEGRSSATLLQAVRYGAASGWGPTLLIDGPGDLSVLDVRVGQEGEGLAVWVEGPFGAGTQRIRSAQYAQGAWRRPLDVSGPGGMDAFRLAMTPSGDGVAVWQQGVSGSRRSIWSNRYVSR